MTARTYDRANRAPRAVRVFAASRPGSWLFSRVLHHVDLVLGRLPGVHRTTAELLAGLPVGVLTTTGARTGQPRRVPLLAIPMDDGWGVIASRWGSPTQPGWLHNLTADPRARFEVDGVDHPVLARRLEGAERERLRTAALAYYAGYAGYEQRAGGRDLGFFLLAPTDAGPPA